MVISAWVPAGPIHEIMGQTAQAIAAVVLSGDQPPPTRWGEPAVLERFFAPARVSVRQERLAFTGPSPRAWVAQQHTHHPAWLRARAVLEPAGLWEDLTGRSLAILETANEDQAGFRVTSDYLVATVEPG